jgi:hypothetical protein
MSHLWEELHRNAMEHEGTGDNIFLTNFEKKIPKYSGCSCRQFWYNWVTRNPPTYTPKGAYFAWTVNTHNAVNAKLGKPQMSLEDAIVLWSPKIEPVNSEHATETM